MTANSIAYAKQQEEARHNVVVEALNDRAQKEAERHNIATEQLGIASFQETERHNRTTETHSFSSLNESRRHNQAVEDENVRHNTATELIDSARASETERHNTMMESLESKSQDIGWYNAYSSRIGASASSTNASASMMQAVTNREYQQGITPMSQAEIGVKSETSSKIHQETSKLQADTVSAQSKARYSNMREAADLTQTYVQTVFSPINALMKAYK